MLKLFLSYRQCDFIDAAASARLCVETIMYVLIDVKRHAAASARLCVETVAKVNVNISRVSSRLRAAVC